MAGITLLGLGPGDPAKLTREAWDVLASAAEIWLRTEHGRLALFTRADGAWSAPTLPEEPLGLRHHRRWIAGLAGAAPRENTARAGLRGLLVAEAIARSNAAGGAEVVVEPV